LVNSHYFMVKKIFTRFPTITTIEKVLLLLILFTVLLKYVFKLNETVDIFGGGLILAIGYFPLGFYYVGKPSVNHGYLFPITTGFFYAIGVVAMMIGALNVYNYFILILVLLFLMPIAIILFFKLKSGSYPKEFIYSNFLRIAFIIAMNLLVLLGHE
jgi:hypothetical protein